MRISIIPKGIEAQIKIFDFLKIIFAIFYIKTF